ncbi:Crp/Fnr family transcriptional regulator [Bosea sp. 2YAB26]|uniref:Crp/Fnr family transcriptional regulator n=1 Tax=Bosea sp. 2YAB26 TaxID=3237478 RepID=UPI003F8F7B52
MPEPAIALLKGLSTQTCEFCAGDAVFHRGDPVRLVHVVHSGCLHLIRHQDDGAALILQRALPGAILAEASLYSEQYHCDGRAETAAVTQAVSRRDLKQALAHDPVLAETWASHLAHEVQRARLHAEIASLKTVKARLDAWIAWNGPLPAKGGWRHIATEIGVSPEALYREIARARAARR